jgi:hypothetical protein
MAQPGATVSWRASAYVDFIGNEGGNLSFGMVDADGAYVNTGSDNAFSVQPAYDFKSVGLTLNRFGNADFYSNGRTGIEKSGILQPFPTSPSWVFLQLDGTAAQGGYMLKVSAHISDSLGNIGLNLGEISTLSPILNQGLFDDPTTYFFFGAGGGFPNNGGYALDDFGLLVPEPSATALLMAALMCTGRRKARFSSNGGGKSTRTENL